MDCNISIDCLLRLGAKWRIDVNNNKIQLNSYTAK